MDNGVRTSFCERGGTFTASFYQAMSRVFFIWKNLFVGLLLPGRRGLGKFVHFQDLKKCEVKELWIFFQ